MVVLGNPSCREKAGVREAILAIEAAEAKVLYLPAYSPDPNPIEMAFSERDRLPRKAAERTAEGVWTAIGRLLERFGPQESRNYIRHCEYAATPS